MKRTVKRGRPVGSKNKPKNVIHAMTKEDFEYHRKIIEERDKLLDQRDQLADELKNAITEVEWYRKQVNHFLALLNIVIRGQ
jgi:hypothetical protein